MRILIIILFCILCVTLGFGFYLRYFTADTLTGDRFLGITILAVAFILMPMFLYHRWKDRKIKDYMLDEENIMKMKEYQDQQERRKPVKPQSEKTQE